MDRRGTRLTRAEPPYRSAPNHRTESEHRSPGFPSENLDEERSIRRTLAKQLRCAGVGWDIAGSAERTQDSSLTDRWFIDRRSN